MKVAGTFDEARRFGAGRVGLVPTMGFLHEGHLSLIEAAREGCDVVLMSLYVNSLQFGEASDLAAYPRDLDRDLSLAEEAGADVVFAPDDDTMYPPGDATRVTVDALSETMEGTYRPGHFEGVATVVAKLFAGLQPAAAYFGKKDAQQLAVVTRMAADLALPVEIHGLPIVREADGLALSSRNIRLSGDERAAALGLSRALMDAADAAEQGELSSPVLEQLVLDRLATAPGVEPEYAAVADRVDVAPIPTLDRPAFLAVAAYVGAVRLIDNVHFELAAGEVRADRGVMLDRVSVLYRSDTETKGANHAAGD